MGTGGEVARRLAGLAARQALSAVERRIAAAAAGTAGSVPPAASSPGAGPGAGSAPPSGAVSPEGSHSTAGTAGFVPPAASAPPAGAPPSPGHEPPAPDRAPSAGPVSSAGPVPPAGRAWATGTFPPAGLPAAGATRQDLVRQVTDRVVATRENAGERLADAYGAVAARRGDPARKHAKRIARAQRKLGFRSVVAGGFGWVTATVGTVPGLEFGEVAWGGATAVFALAALGAGARLGELKRTPPPPPRARDLPRPKRPPRDSPARGPLDRLAKRERALAGLLDHLGPAGDEPRAVAVDAAATLRELGARTAAVDQARRSAAPASAAGLEAAVAALVAQLEGGVAAYDALVVAAADAVAASATLHAGDPVLLHRLEEATDSLAGLAQGLHEVAG